MLPPTIPKQPISRSSGELTFIEPATAAVYPGRAAEHLVEQRLRVDAERERVPVPPVRRGDAVALLEQAREADRDGLLARVQVRRPVDLAAQEERLDEVLEPADQAHAPVEVEVELGVLEDGFRLASCQLLRQVFPVALEAVGVAVGRPRRRGLEPLHRPAFRLVERVDAADGGPEDVSGTERVAGRRLRPRPPRPRASRTTPRTDGRAGARPRRPCSATMNIVCSCASSRLSTSIFTVIPL